MLKKQNISTTKFFERRNGGFLVNRINGKYISRKSKNVFIYVFERCFFKKHFIRKPFFSSVVPNMIVGLNGVASGRSEMQRDGVDHSILSREADMEGCTLTKYCQIDGGGEEIIVFL